MGAGATLKVGGRARSVNGTSRDFPTVRQQELHEGPAELLLEFAG